jgi:hypothetical protein
MKEKGARQWVIVFYNMEEEMRIPRKPKKIARP